MKLSCGSDPSLLISDPQIIDEGKNMKDRIENAIATLKAGLKTSKCRLQFAGFGGKKPSRRLMGGIAALSVIVSTMAAPSVMAIPAVITPPFPYSEWVNAPTSGDWSPGGDTIFTIALPSNLQVNVTSQTSLNADAAYYVIFDPVSRTFEAFPTITTLSNNNKTATLIADGVMFRADGQTIQFFINTQGSFVPLVSPAYRVRGANSPALTPTPGPQPIATPIVPIGPSRILLPFTLNPMPINSASFEPNNTACEAKPVDFDKDYHSLADDEEDWYYFDLPSDGLVQVYFKNYPTRPATEGEFQIYRGFSQDCTLVQADNNAVHGRFSDNSYPTINMGLAEQPLGRYYLRVSTRKNKNTSEPYFFRLTRNTINEWSPWVQACPQFRHCDAPKNDGTIPLYWFGMNDASTITINSTGEAVGGCPAGIAFERNPTATEFGVEKISNLPNGYYKIRVMVTWHDRSTWVNEIPVKVGCQFLNTRSALDRR